MVGITVEASKLPNGTTENERRNHTTATTVNVDSNPIVTRSSKVEERNGVSSLPDDQNGIHSEAPPPPIAIVGMAMRLPGGINTADDFWDLLINKKDARSTVPESRYNIDAFYHPRQPQSVKTRHGYFLQEDYVGRADTSFFQMSSYEARALDPQQMLLMEVIWECMESAGQTGWRGKEIGCYVGVFGEDWQDISSKESQEISRAHAFATGGFALSNRVSYEYDLRGPSVTLQTACSSSMVALHEACQALCSGSCASAIVAGTNMIMTPTMTTSMSDNMVLSPSGHCKTFDASADGYARGEAVNAIYIKKLDQALQDGDPIRAIIRSTSANFDGRTDKIFSPGAESQERLIRQAYRRAHIQDVSQTAFFECHGTGTRAGDVPETTAVANVFKPKGVYIGAVKPNVGHGEGASGITALIKTVLALEHRTIPPNIHFHNPNPKIPFAEGALRVPVEPTPWPNDRKERASVNCFGIGGANAHVILDSASSVGCQVGDGDSYRRCGGSRLLLMSAASEQSLQRRVDDIQAYFKRKPETLHDLAYTLGARREHLTHRGFIIANKDGTLDEPKLQASGGGPPPNVVFAFTGQGCQWPGMGKELIETFESFRNDIKMMDQVLQTLKKPPTWSIEEELLKSKECDHINEAEFSQPLCAAIQIGLVNLLAQWGIHPAAVVGHSSGEIAAAYAAKAIPIEVAIIIAYYRGQAAKSNRRPGGMAVVGLGPEAASRFLVDGVMIACENSPRSVNLSGDKDKLAIVLNRILADRPETFCRNLPVEVAYHSHHMLDLGPAYESMISPHIMTNESMTPMYSSVTGKIISSPGELNAAYWRRNMESPVLFSAAVEGLLGEKKQNRVFLEIGPHSALSGPLRQLFTDRKEAYPYVATLRKGEEQSTSLLRMAGQMYLHNYPVDFVSVNGPGTVLADLPIYPWHRQNLHWQESRISRNWRFRKFPHHELLGSRMLESSDLEPAWRNLLRVENVMWISDHKLGNDVVFPCAGYVAMVTEAMRQISGAHDCTIRNLFMKEAVILHEAKKVELVTTFKPVKLTDRVDSVWYDFTIASYSGNTWTKHCVGQARHGMEEPQRRREIKPFARTVSSPSWYKTLKKVGLNYGPRFQGLQDITADPVNFTAAATLLDDSKLHDSEYAIHPVVIDQCLQLFSVADCRGITRRMNKLSIPILLESIYISQGSPLMFAEVSGNSRAANRLSGDATVMSNDEVVLSIREAKFFAFDDRRISQETEFPLASHVEWRPDIDCMPAKDQLGEPVPREGPMQLLAQLSILSIIQIAHVVRDISPTAPHLRKYQNWIQEQAGQIQHDRQALVPEAQVWATLDSAAMSACRRDLNKRLNEAQLDAFSELSQRVVDTCADILRDSASPSEVLMHDNGLEKLYELLASTSDLTSFFTLLRHSNPTLRVLEIGAGTGALTACALKALTSDGTRFYSRYTVTDISSTVLSAAKERFKKYNMIDYTELDITRDPAEQGFKPRSYDLVIASNVLHATPRLNIALQNIRTLLVPGGRVLVRELSSAIPFIDYIMGLLPDWWIGENDQRSDKPYVSSERWDEELRNAGFTGVEAVTYDSRQPYHLNANIISRTTSVGHLQQEPITLLRSNSADSHPCGREVEELLSQRGYTVRWRTLDQPIPANQWVISLLDLDGPFFKNMSEDNFTAFKALVSASPRVLWVTESAQVRCDDPDFGLALGVSRTMRQEEGLHFATVEIDRFDSYTADALVKVYEKFSKQIVDDDSTNIDYEFALHDGIIHTGRFHWTSLTDQLLADPKIESPVKLDLEAYGILDSLCWTQKEVGHDQLGPDEVEVDIKYVGLNFRDIMTSMGFVADKSQFGVEASGTIRRVGSNVKDFRVGEGVIVIETGLFCTRKVTLASRCWRVPASLSLSDVATMATVYFTALYSLMNLGGLEQGQSVLIHAACGGVGIAAIQICQMIGAEVYATVGSEKKVQYLMDTFGIPRDHIFNSRDTSFLPDVMRMTNGKGVDIVLNSLAGELLHASWKCVAKFGKMIEIGKRDFKEHGMLSMDVFEGNRAFFGFDIQQLCEDRLEVARRLFDRMIDYYEQGKIKPIRPLKIFEATEIQQAFRYMQQGLHMGKIIVKMPDSVTNLPVARARQAFSLSSEVSYLLVGGLGGVGRAAATWMVEKGARHLVFLSRSAGESAADQAFFRELEAQGCSAVAARGDVANLDDVKRAVAVSSRPIGGVIQLTMILRDQFISEMSYENWRAALAPKVDGTWNLHHALSSENLQFFVVFGSIAGVLGNAGQTNYAAANTFLGSFVQYRHQQGLPASIVNLGAVDEVGYLTRNTRLRENMRSGAIRLLSEKDVLDALELAICRQKPSEGSAGGLIPSELALGMSSTKPLSDPSVRPMWGRDARFSLYVNLEQGQGERHQHQQDETTEFRRAFLDAVETNPKILEDSSVAVMLTNEICKAIRAYTAYGEMAGSEMPIDSLMSIEIRSWYRRNLGLEIPLVEIAKAGTVEKMGELTLGALRTKYLGR